MKLLQMLLDKSGAVRVGSLGGGLFLFRAYHVRPDGAAWPPVMPRWKRWLLLPLCWINNKIILH